MEPYGKLAIRVQQYRRIADDLLESASTNETSAEQLVQVISSNMYILFT